MFLLIGSLGMGRWKEMCTVCILGSGERRLYSLSSSSPAWTVCLVLSMKQRRSPWRTENTKQARFALLQPNICVLQGISLLQEHLTSFSKSSVARGVTGKSCLNKSFGSIRQWPLQWCWVHFRRISLQTISPEFHLEVRGAHLHWLSHLLKAEKPVLVHHHNLAHRLPTFSGGHCQWRTFTLPITCLALITSSWTHTRGGRPVLTSHGYPSKHDPMITCQNDWCCMASDLGQNATCDS